MEQKDKPMHTRTSRCRIMVGLRFARSKEGRKTLFRSCFPHGLKDHVSFDPASCYKVAGAFIPDSSSGSRSAFELCLFTVNSSEALIIDGGLPRVSVSTSLVRSGEGAAERLLRLMISRSTNEISLSESDIVIAGAFLWFEILVKVLNQQRNVRV